MTKRELIEKLIEDENLSTEVRVIAGNEPYKILSAENDGDFFYLLLNDS